MIARRFDKGQGNRDGSCPVRRDKRDKTILQVSFGQVHMHLALIEMNRNLYPWDCPRCVWRRSHPELNQSTPRPVFDFETRNLSSIEKDFFHRRKPHVPAICSRVNWSKAWFR